MNFDHLRIYNCVFRHCQSGVYFQASNNSIIDHCLFEDIGETAAGFGGCLYTGINNSIFNSCHRVSHDGQAINYWAENDYTFVTNCDISNGASSGIQFGHNNEYDVDKVRHTLVQNNHIHHLGFKKVDDIAGVFFGRHPKGVILGHNCVHDVRTHNYCGNGLYADTGSSGAIWSNNLIYDVDNNALNLNYGMNHIMVNNILAFAEFGISYGENAHSETWTINASRNIFYMGKGNKTYLGNYLNGRDTNYLDNNLFYSTETNDFKFLDKNFTEWKEKGFDVNSEIGNPHFVNPEQRNFAFTDDSKEILDKIGFEQFNLTFGVIDVDANDHWREKAASYTYPPNLVQYPRVPFIVDESFERGDQTNFMKRAIFYTNGNTMAISDEKAHIGTHSHKWVGDVTLSLPCKFKEGHGEIEFYFLPNENCDTILDFGVESWVFIKNGQISYPYGTKIAEYTVNQWTQIKFEKFFNLTVNGIKYNLSYVNSNYEELEYARISSVKDTIYMDDIHIFIDTPDHPFFENEKLILINQISGGNDDDNDHKNDGDDNDHKNDNDDNDGDKNDKDNADNSEGKSGLGAGGIVGIVFAALIVTSIVIVITIVYIRKHRSDDEETVGIQLV
ncbi:hypothetical protein TVAG_229240 [Trichomonas vaginalis G3]|uniref:Right handed beta helix domain-containing protein n=1 Tax=Trichomonas vaginalis (strain ATCC PRA-98 / G3) TaxID=412133 RepID=A2FBR0_TRIV3|nr:secreted protein-related family [Trichomonas vaginalis G3]EAX97657.1 hypothetical protein TVAG_229240 [Trichomonas vaginalis G3]KAI5510374.1 secreted protein-related family [Trichomonas vaginalis G3]|eukprot:XP_001310587.1 hypothetical protein [Trichomonas vaginalis G3]